MVLYHPIHVYMQERVAAALRIGLGRVKFPYLFIYIQFGVLTALIMSDVSTISVFLLTRSAISPFHLPFSLVPHLPSSTRTSS
ncbi:unnamed protein product [Acanthoscelides obtectus]|uniref:Uncharacterized protein n=1 Tax=Acanthoscelides obtectus TaxID=200917 RepID=A0A9P0KPD3_ACAOB|nr:unnamed protein product [Acanthoscelides obtectus]CAK1653720.1 hypothetical protein AOBTE_LOCUS18342 [Acanthoscelides obtectus]